MYRLTLIVLFSLLSFTAAAQQPAEAEKLVEQGVALEDSGQSQQAIMKYQQALDIDKDNLSALTEMAYSLLTLNKNADAVKYCKRAIKTHKGEQGLNVVYVSYGNALDAMKDADHSIEIYDEGIRLFPDYYQLYFNKGISLAGKKNNQEAISCFQRSATIKPGHAGSHNALGNILLAENKKIPALMAYSRFLVIEPESKRSVNALANLREIMKANITHTGENAITIHISMDTEEFANAKGKPNNFSAVELVLTFSSALDSDSLFKNQTPVERFIGRMDKLCSSLRENEKDNYGFYWDYYAPYFIEMKERSLLETFGYIAFASDGEKNVTEWLKLHDKQVETFYQWSEDFKWRINQ